MRNARIKSRTKGFAGGAVLVLVVLLYGLSDELPTRISTAPTPPVILINGEAQDPLHSSGAPRAEGEVDPEDETKPLANMPPPFLERRLDFLAEGEAPPAETAAYCADANWSRMDLLVGRSDNGAFRVDESAWDRALTGSKAGIANWMSQCHQAGAAIEIVAAESGQKLATYDPQYGLTTLQ